MCIDQPTLSSSIFPTGDSVYCFAEPRGSICLLAKLADTAFCRCRAVQALGLQYRIGACTPVLSTGMISLQ